MRSAQPFQRQIIQGQQVVIVPAWATLKNLGVAIGRIAANLKQSYAFPVTKALFLENDQLPEIHCFYAFAWHRVD